MLRLVAAAIPSGGDDDRLGPDAGTIDARRASRGSTPSCTSPAPASATRSGPPSASRRSSTAGSGAPRLLAGTVAASIASRRVFVSGSAVGYYGNRGDELLTEDSHPGDDFLADVCAVGGRARPAAEAGVRIVGLRTGLVLAKHGGVLQRMLLPFKLGLGGRHGSGKQ